ncbi:MAG TPA: phosphatase PAP2 family protein [Ilumatobacter sp.]
MAVGSSPRIGEDPKHVPHRDDPDQLAIALMLLWRIDLVRYLLLRNTLMISAALGLVIFGLFPVSPPRFLDGYVDLRRWVVAGARRCSVGRQRAFAILAVKL